MNLIVKKTMITSFAIVLIIIGIGLLLWQKTSMSPKPAPLPAVEKFDIAQFNERMKDGGASDMQTLPDGTTVQQFTSSNGGYVENTVPATGWYSFYKEFYASGSLKKKGQEFKSGNNQAGIWYEYDEAGKITKETDYDKQFKLTLDQVLAIVKKQGLEFSPDNKEGLVHVYRMTDPTPNWMIQFDTGEPDYENRIGEGNRRRVIKIYDATGEVFLDEVTGKPGSYPEG